MAANPPGGSAATPKQVYQYASWFLRRNYLLTAEEIGARLRAAGVSFAQGVLNSQYALASYNVGREPTQIVEPTTSPLPLSAYREVTTPGGGPFRVTAVADVYNALTQTNEQRAITLTSRRSLSPDEWFNFGVDAFLTLEQRYQYTLIDLNIIDPRMRS